MLFAFTLTGTVAHAGSSSSIAISGPRPWTGPLPLLLVFFLLGLPVSIEHDRVEIAELRFYNSRYPLNHINLWRLDLAILDWWEILWLHILGLRVGLKMQGLPDVIMRQRIYWWKIRIYDHRVLRLGYLSPIRKAVIVAPFGPRRRRLLRELVGLRGVVVNRHGRRVVSLEVTVHFGNVSNGRIVTHWVNLVVLTITIIRLPIHTRIN